jgi:hypothetical protein
MGRCSFVVKEIVENMNKKKETAKNIESQHEGPSINSQITRSLTRALTKGETEDAKTKAEEVKKEQSKQDKEDENRCRICLSSTSELENPLIMSPCKCTGSVQLIHINCLNQWLHSKVVETKSSNVTSYTWKPFECDVCKFLYPGF